MSRIQLVHAESDVRLYFMGLVEDAIANQNFQATDVSQFYIVNLLSEFAKTGQLFERDGDHYEEMPLALMLSKAMNSDQGTRIKLLKKMGDTSLYIAGYFSEHIDSKLVDIDYYMSMGEGAYENLSGIFVSEKTFFELYEELYMKFIGFVNILSEVRSSSKITTNSELLRLYERWLRTGSSMLRKRLEKEGLVTKAGDLTKKR